MASSGFDSDDSARTRWHVADSPSARFRPRFWWHAPRGLTMINSLYSLQIDFDTDLLCPSLLWDPHTRFVMPFCTGSSRFEGATRRGLMIEKRPRLLRLWDENGLDTKMYDPIWSQVCYIACAVSAGLLCDMDRIGVYFFCTWALSRTSSENPCGSKVSRNSGMSVEAIEPMTPVLWTHHACLSFVHLICWFVFDLLWVRLIPLRFPSLLFTFLKALLVCQHGSVTTKRRRNLAVPLHTRVRVASKNMTSAMAPSFNRIVASVQILIWIVDTCARKS